MGLFVGPAFPLQASQIWEESSGQTTRPLLAATPGLQAHCLLLQRTSLPENGLVPSHVLVTPTGGSSTVPVQPAVPACLCPDPSLHLALSRSNGLTFQTRASCV